MIIKTNHRQENIIVIIVQIVKEAAASNGASGVLYAGLAAYHSVLILITN